MNKRLIFYAFIAAPLGLMFGFDTAVVNGTPEFFRKYRVETKGKSLEELEKETLK